MKENKKILKRKERGITLIALVITIIVLLILAGVSIAMLTGQNGILTQAQNAKKQTEQAKSNEASILGSYGDIINAATAVTGGEWSEEKLVNTPALNENMNMELVRYNEEGEWTKDETGSNYSYVEGNNKSEWANAKVTIDGVDSYFVWIPRYAYKINYNEPGNISAGGTIDVKFLKGTSNIAADGTVCKYADDSSLNKETDYIIHPAFTSNVNLGGWRNELTGIWVGKYESSHSDATASEIGSSEKWKIQPNVKLARNIKIGDMYNYAREYSEDLNSHMVKNSEWGAVAYLTYSQYGRNGQDVSRNENSNMLTAGGDMASNINQSSTGNVYGIYDLSGGAYEYVAAYYNGSNSSKLKDNGESFASAQGNSTEYVTVYTGTDINQNYIVGDATYETNGWESNRSIFYKK